MTTDRSAAPPAAPTPARHARYAVTAATLVLGLAITYAAYRFADDAANREAERVFGARSADIRDAIRDRMATYAQVLRGGTGFFGGSDHIERAEWHAYVQALQIETTYPGIQGIGVIERVAAVDLDRHERTLRADGYQKYAVFPRGNRPQYMPVIYIEPMERNLGSLGYDASSEPVRREALERAVASGEPVLSGMVRLKQQAGVDAQPGLVMYAAVFRRGVPLATPRDRNAALRGFIYGRFRVYDLMRGVLGAVPDVRLEIFDGAGATPAALLYDSASALADTPRTPRFAAVMHTFVQDRPWTLRATSLGQFEQTIDRTRPRNTVVFGLLVSAMLTVLAWLLATSRERALRLAQGMTEELRESRERLGLAIEGSHLAMFDWDLRSDAVRLSPRWNAMLGGGFAETTTTSVGLQALVHPDDVSAVREALGRALSGAAPFYHVEHRVRMNDGTWKWILSRGKVTGRDDNGRPLRFTGVNADISERKAIEDMKNEFIGTVSHELRSPLTSLIGALALLKEEYGGKAPPEAATFLEMAYQNGERLAALVNDILDLEKVDAGKLELHLEPVELTPLLEQTAALNSAYATKYGTRFEIDPPGPITVRADRQRLTQVLTNLMTNAAKHSSAGAAVTLRASAGGGRARLEVIDRGPGVPHAFRERIFTRFAQADASDTRAKGGTGLGLSLSKAMTEAMHGEIGFDSTPGEGATFYVLLPLAD